MSQIHYHAIFLYLQFFSCTAMTGIIWIVQLILYPSFQSIDRAKFEDFHLLHVSRISWIVGPAMVVELASACGLLYISGGIGWWLNLLSILVIWMLTFLVSVPIHNRLSHEAREDLVTRLIHTNWPRTILWSSRLVILSISLILV